MKLLLLFFSLWLIGCGPGWEAYEDQYQAYPEVSSTTWEGEERVQVVYLDAEAMVPLKGLPIEDYLGAPAVSLAEIVRAAELVEDPSPYRFNFTASDGYDLLIKRQELDLLPGWGELEEGVLYLDLADDDLSVGWRSQPWGSALSAYQLKWMNGGIITLIEGR